MADRDGYVLTPHFFLGPATSGLREYMQKLAEVWKLRDGETVGIVLEHGELRFAVLHGGRRG